MRLKTRSSAILLAAAVAASTLGTDTYSVMAQEETATEAVTEEKEVASEEEVTEEKKEETTDEEKEEASEEVTEDEKEEASDETADEKTEKVSDVEQENEADVAGVHVPDTAEVKEEIKVLEDTASSKKQVRLVYTVKDIDSGKVFFDGISGDVTEVGIEICVSEINVSCPDGYEWVTQSFIVPENGKVILQIRKVEAGEENALMHVNFKDETGNQVGGGDYFLPVGVQNRSILEQYVPVGYEMTETGDFTVVDGGSIDVTVKKINTEVIMNIQFKDGEEVVAGGDYFVPEGVQNYSVLQKYVPAGYVMTVSGDFYAEEGGKLDVNVEKINKEIIMNISFKDGDEVVAGGDYFVPEGVQNYSVLQKYVPEGYVMTVSGDFMAVEGTHLDVNVEKAEKQVIMNIRFMDGETFVAGGDYFVMEGVQNYSVLEQYVPEGYKMAVSGDFYAEEGGKLDVRVEKIQKDIIMNISFIVRNDDGSETVVAGGDYFVPEGIQNYSVLEQYVPEGYVMVVGGDFFAEAGTHLDVFIEKVAENPDPNPGDEGTDDTDDGDEGTTGGGTTTTGGTAATAAVLGARVDAPAAPEAGVLGERVEQPAAEAGVLGERKSADTADNTPVGVWTALAGTAVAALAAFGLKRKKEEK